MSAHGHPGAATLLPDQPSGLDRAARAAALFYRSLEKSGLLREVNGDEEPAATGGLRPAVPAEVRDCWQKSRHSQEHEALRATVGLEDHVAFVERVLASHKWPAATASQARDQLELIRSRLSDPRLFLGVVGEFSSGKSTLINALLRDELLRTDVLQGTTVSPTVLSFGASLDAEVLFSNGSRVRYETAGASLAHRLARALGRVPASDQQAALRAFIHRYTAEEDQGRQVAVVNVLHPSPRFLEGLVIVDTPGTNVDNPRHREVTARALRELCDAALVVIPADRPLPQSLVEVLRDHLGEVLHRCVFAVTKIDTLRARERPRFLDTLKARIRHELGLEEPVLLPVAPELVLAHLRPEEDDVGGALSFEARRELLDQFEESERRLYDLLRHHNLLVPLESLSGCLATLLGQLRGQLAERDEAYRREHEALERNRIPDLEAFVAEKKRDYLAELEAEVEPLREAMHARIEEGRRATLRTLQAEIRSTGSRESLKSVLGARPAALMRESQQRLIEALAGTQECVADSAERLHEEFKAEFHEIYRSLATLDGALADGDVELGSELDDSALGDLDGATTRMAVQVGEEIDADVLKKVGGASAGAVVGTMLLPGIGTVLGALAGGFLGGLFGPSLEDLQSKYASEIEPPVRRSFEQFEASALQALDQVASSAACALEAVIDRHFEVYERLVEELKARDDKQAARLRKLRQRVASDLDEFASRQGMLQESRQRLRNG